MQKATGEVHGGTELQPVVQSGNGVLGSIISAVGGPEVEPKEVKGSV